MSVVEALVLAAIIGAVFWYGLAVLAVHLINVGSVIFGLPT